MAWTSRSRSDQVDLMWAKISHISSSVSVSPNAGIPLLKPVPPLTSNAVAPLSLVYSQHFIVVMPRVTCPVMRRCWKLIIGVRGLPVRLSLKVGTMARCAVVCIQALPRNDVTLFLIVISSSGGGQWQYDNFEPLHSRHVHPCAHTTSGVTKHMTVQHPATRIVEHADDVTACSSVN